MRKIIVLLGIAMVLISCGGSKKAVISRTKKTPTKRTTVLKAESDTKKVIPEKKSVSKTPSKRTAPLSYQQRVQQYIDNFSEIAMSEMKTYGIPASITLAQGILESGAGNGELTRRAKNHFGIKCHKWTGDRVYHDDDRSQECFRKYDHAEESFRDHSLFLKNRKRYARLFTFNQRDYKSWAKGLREAGYATDRKYPEKLISIIERYQLQAYDDQVLGPRNKRKARKERNTDTAIISSNSSPTPTPVSKDGEHVVQKGDTLYSISKRYEISVQELKAYNNLADNNIKIGQVLRVADDDEEEEDFN